MTKSRNFIVFVCVTASTSVCCITLICACRFGYYCSVLVTESRNFICHIGVTTSTSICCITRSCTCRLGYYCIVLVSKSINYFLCNKNLVTYRTVLTFSKTCSFTSCINCCIDHFSMTESRNFIAYIRITASTSIRCITIFCTRRRGYYCTTFVFMLFNYNGGYRFLTISIV